jgi:hypothetical protein
MRRWLSRDVVGLLSAPAGVGGGAEGALVPEAPGAPGMPGVPAASGMPAVPGRAEERRAPRFAARSMIRSVRLHQPARGIVESTVVVQDGPRVRAVALRFEQIAPPAQGSAGRTTGKGRPSGFDWMCTALQFT